LFNISLRTGGTGVGSGESVGGVTTPVVVATSVPSLENAVVAPSSGFNAIQEQIASQGNNYTLNSDGTLEQQTKDGVKIVSWLKFDPRTGECTFYGGASSEACDPNSIVIGADNSVTIDLKNGDKWTTANGIDWAKLDTFVNVSPTGEKFDAQTWASMSAADRTKAIDALPATSPDGYTKGNESTVKDNLVKYYDPKSGKAVEAYDLLTGKFETMQAAGIAEFPMKSGGVYEMESFISSDPGSIEAANSMLEQAIVVDGVKYGIGVANSSINLLKFLSSLRSIDGFAPNAFTDATFSVPNGGYMEYAAFDLDGGTVFLFVSKTNQPKVKYLSGVSPADFVNNLNSGTYTIPAKPTN
jgi:hypothetical protein